MPTAVDTLESEAIFILREVAAQFDRPVMLFSGGKDSIVLLHLARKAFSPAKQPFPLLHIDTGHNFAEVIAVRDQIVAKAGAQLLIARVQDDIDHGRITEQPGTRPSRNALQTITLLRALREGRYDAVIGGARRDEERSRAKERIFSLRTRTGEWDPRSQRPELWNLYNGRHQVGEHIRVFPLSNFTELDLWRYIGAQNVVLPSLYFSHSRDVIVRDGLMLAFEPPNEAEESDHVARAHVRFRTVGDVTCTGAVESAARTVDEVIAEIASTRQSERGATRADDRIGEAAMEDRKRVGYF